VSLRADTKPWQSIVRSDILKRPLDLTRGRLDMVLRRPTDDNPDGLQVFDRCNVFELPMNSVPAHGGIGAIDFVRFVHRGDVSGHCNFMDYTIMPPGTSIGRHRHAEDEEEFYVILSGRGEMVRNGEHFDVKPGDVIRNPPGGEHELRNSGPDELKMLVFELAIVNKT